MNDVVDHREAQGNAALVLGDVVRHRELGYLGTPLGEVFVPADNQTGDGPNQGRKPNKEQSQHTGHGRILRRPLTAGAR